MDKSLLSYKSEEDRSYGATGMAISLVMFDGSNLISAISLDSDPDKMMELDDEFYFAGNPGLSAKSAWNKILQSFNLTVAMTIGNVMSRSMILNRRMIDEPTTKLLHDIIVEEGESTCSLEEDECNRLFEKNFRYLYRVFNHRGVHDLAHDFASHLKRSRRLTRSEVLDLLRGLNVI